MIHIDTKPLGSGMELLYLMDDQEVFAYPVSRVVAGVSYPNADMDKVSIGMGFCCIVAERVFRFKERNDRMYVVVDEFETLDDVGLFEKLVEKKDRYRISTVSVPSNPASVLESMRRHEGIAWYAKRPFQENRYRWPSFVSSDTKASVREVKLPDRGNMRRDIEALRMAKVIHPEYGSPVLDTNWQSVPKLVIPKGFENQKTENGLAAGTSEVLIAAWLAISFLENSRVPIDKGTEWEAVPNNDSGY